MTDTTIVKSDMLDETLLNQRIDDLKGRIIEEKNKNNIRVLKEHLARLIGKKTIIYVGGTTEVEAKEKYDRVEDAVCAVKAALDEGYVVGGGTALYDVWVQEFINLTNVDIDVNPSFFEGIVLVLKSLVFPLKTLCENSGFDYASITVKLDQIDRTKSCIDFNTGEVCDAIVNGIIDPFKVERCALENAVSVASMILTTECIVPPLYGDKFM